MIFIEAHPDHPQELAYLNDVLAHLCEEIPLISQQKDALDARVAYSLAHMNVDNPESYSELTVSLSLLNGWKTRLRQMKYARSKPYFARVDFDGAAHYIGKMTLLRGLEVLITDWRAPLATLYYEGRLGRAAYDCPDGHITGELTLKRQYQIEDGTLASFMDIDITASDTFLQAALGASKDRRLRDIVTTIQAEQNRIIRAPLETDLIVQGAAGSGKTTIALHRIAYLLYTHEDKLKASDVMILAPSRFFISYISEVLPELGVEDVTQTTFAEFVAGVLAESGEGTAPTNAPFGNFSLAQPLDALREAVQGGVAHTPRMHAAGLKGSLRFHEIIRRYLRRIEEALLPQEDFAVEDYTLFAREKIAELFTQTYTFLPTNKRAPEIEKYITNTLNRRLPQIERRIRALFDNHMAKIRALMPEDTPARRARYTRVIAKRDTMLKQIHEKAKPNRKKYMRTFRLKPALHYYTALFTTSGLLEELAQGILTPDEASVLGEQTRLALARGVLEQEDLPALLFMHKHLFGVTATVRHAVIDEAQDYSEFQFLALRETLPAATFSVFGDLHQGMLAHKGISDWENVCKILTPAKNTAVQVLTQSYRTTIEIMNAANAIINRLYADGETPAVPLAVPVIRHGGAVKNITAHTNIAAAVASEITAAHEAGCNSVAVICKTDAACRALQAELLQTAPTQAAPIITEDAADYEGGVLILPAYLAKGLEFDAVIITEAAAYSDSPQDIKLLYIAMTRALHRLAVFEKGVPL